LVAESPNANISWKFRTTISKNCIEGGSHGANWVATFGLPLGKYEEFGWDNKIVPFILTTIYLLRFAKSTNVV
jgi:hypothetical protein